MRHPRQGAKAYGGRMKRSSRRPPPSPYRSRTAVLQMAEQLVQSGADQHEITDFFIQVGEKRPIILGPVVG
jgi:hypothetical protein